MDVFRRINALALAACSIGFVVCGVAMFWGPPRQVFTAPLVIAVGVLGYMVSRTLWHVVRREPWTRA